MRTTISPDICVSGRVNGGRLQKYSRRSCKAPQSLRIFEARCGTVVQLQAAYSLANDHASTNGGDGCGFAISSDLT